MSRTIVIMFLFFFFSSRRRHTRYWRDWSSDVCSSDLREAFFLLNNLVLVGLCLVIFWGTFFPLISEALTGTEESVGPPWFNRLTTPLALVLVALAGIGPLVAWRRITRSGLRRVLLLPGAAALLALVLLGALPPSEHSPPALLMSARVASVLAPAGQDCGGGASARGAATGGRCPNAPARLTGPSR